MKQQIEILDKSCTVYQRSDVPQMLLLQLVDEHDREELDTEMEWIVSHSTVDFRFIAVHVDRWFDELAPWPAPPVFGKTPFGNGATKTLDSLRQIAGEEQQRMAASVETPIKVIIGGYSLAGLFALWAGYQTDQPFDTSRCRLSFGVVSRLARLCHCSSASVRCFLSQSRRPRGAFAHAYSDNHRHGHPPSATIVGTGSYRQRP